mmetsp:Transcript_61759/g.112945  ORF Transcript_61759/g.112945 Transcript_61759/m.112945 type:complete len:146 (+) Transcript_61759:78-515(+)
MAEQAVTQAESPKKRAAKLLVAAAESGKLLPTLLKVEHVSPKDRAKLVLVSAVTAGKLDAVLEKVYAGESEAQVAEQAVMETFKAYDTDGSGFMSRTELEDVFRELGEWTEEEFEEIFNQVDINDDGKVHYQEFLKWCLENDVIE